MARYGRKGGNTAIGARQLEQQSRMNGMAQDRMEGLAVGKGQGRAEGTARGQNKVRWLRRADRRTQKKCEAE